MSRLLSLYSAMPKRSVKHSSQTRRILAQDYNIERYLNRCLIVNVTTFPSSVD